MTPQQPLPSIIGIASSSTPCSSPSLSRKPSTRRSSPSSSPSLRPTYPSSNCCAGTSIIRSSSPAASFRSMDGVLLSSHWSPTTSNPTTGSKRIPLPVTSISMTRRRSGSSSSTFTTASSVASPSHFASLSHRLSALQSLESMGADTDVFGRDRGVLEPRPATPDAAVVGIGEVLGGVWR